MSWRECLSKTGWDWLEKRILIILLLCAIAVSGFAIGYIKGSADRWNSIKSDFLEGIKVERAR